jgi:hypothetical protein
MTEHTQRVHTGRSYSLPIGQEVIQCRLDENATVDFLNGFQAGYLAYRLDWCMIVPLDTAMIMLFAKRQKTPCGSLFYDYGFLAGWLATCVRKSSGPVLTSKAFADGQQAGIQTYRDLGQQVLTLSEVCTLLSYRHGPNSAYNAGYVCGFVKGLTLGRRACKPSLPGEGTVLR